MNTWSLFTVDRIDTMSRQTCSFLLQCFLFMCVMDLITCQRPRANVTLIDNGYEGLLIAIGEDVSESQELIQRTKDHFTKMSQALFTATKRRAYLRNVTILVPTTWQNTSIYGQAGLEAYEKANIVINKDKDDTPFVLQSPGTENCTKPGPNTMYLTPSYMTNDKKWYDEVGLSPAKTLLHEWGHLRWGLFDEYAVLGKPQVYVSNTTDRLEGVRCSRDVVGSVICDSSGTPENCTFTVALESTSDSLGTASIMSHHFLEKVTGFCDNNTEDRFSLHNNEAPNRQNYFCEGRSAWEIMRNHDDFKDGRNPSISNDVPTNTTPFFKVLRQQPKRFVLILDVSGSMGSDNKLINLKKVCTTFVNNTLEENNQVAIVKFESGATILQYLTEINNQSARNQMVNVINGLDFGGGTCIGCGLLRGIEVLERNGRSASGGIFVVVSDGMEGQTPLIRDVKPTVIAKEIQTDVLLFTTNADNQLISLAKDTGGLSFFESGNIQSTGLTDAFSKIATQRASGSKNILVQVMSESITVGRYGASYHGSVYIDSTIGNSTMFSFTWASGVNSITVTLTRPDNVTIVPSAIDYDYRSGALTIRIAGTAQVGRWLYTVTNTNASDAIVQVQVSSRSSKDTAPIVLRASVSSDTIDFADPASSRLVVFGELMQGYASVLGAHVMAYVEVANRDLNHRTTRAVQLHDNGAGADLTMNDGVYTAYFVEFVGNETYSVRLKAVAREGASIKSGGRERSPLTLIPNPNATGIPGIIYTPIEPFERTDSAGLFTVTNLPSPKSGTTGPLDLYPPAPIHDLRLVVVNTENTTVTLSWTATGDDLDQGNASGYDMRYGLSSTGLRNNFNNNYKLLNQDLILGNLESPRPAGRLETFIIQFNQTDDQNQTYFLALKAMDENGRTGKMSNIVSFSFDSYLFPFTERATSAITRIDRMTSTQPSTAPRSDGMTSTQPSTAPRSDEMISTEPNTSAPNDNKTSAKTNTTADMTSYEPVTISTSEGFEGGESRSLTHEEIAIIGGSAAAAAVLLIVIISVAVICVRRKRNTNDELQPTYNEPLSIYYVSTGTVKTTLSDPDQQPQV